MTAFRSNSSAEHDLIFIDDVRDIFENKISYSFKVDVETAWEPHMAVFYKILREKYDNRINLVYMSEECGSRLWGNVPM